MRIEIEHGAIIADDEGGLWRVLEASDEELFLLMLPEREEKIMKRPLRFPSKRFRSNKRENRTQPSA